MYYLKKLFNPEIFQGKNKSKKYFEGWYYKIVDKDESNSFAFIPGIAYDKNRKGHSFVQIIDSINYRTEYFKFPISEFIYSEEVLDVIVGDKNYLLSISGKYNRSGILRAPKNGLMERKISESISSTVQVILKNKDGDIIFEDYGKNAGLEVVGKHL